MQIKNKNIAKPKQLVLFSTKVRIQYEGHPYNKDGSINKNAWTIWRQDVEEHVAKMWQDLKIVDHLKYI